MKSHYTFPATLSYEDTELIRLEAVVGGMVIHYTRGFRRPQSHPTTFTFWRDRWYNVFANFNNDGTLNNFYCNVATPPVINENTVSFVDLDLDVQVKSDGTSYILDEDEFDLHRIQYGYPEDVQANARRAVEELIAMANAREGPFSALPPR